LNSCNNDTQDRSRILLVIATQFRFVIVVNVVFVPSRALTLRFTDYIHGKFRATDNSSPIIYRLRRRNGNKLFRDPRRTKTD